MTCRLLVLAGVDKGTQYPVQPSGTVVIGRGQDVQLQLHDPRISRAHCQIVMKGSNSVVSDLGSRGGTFVNGKPVQSPQVLKLNDVVQIGDTQIRFEGVADSLEQTLPPPVATPPVAKPPVASPPIASPPVATPPTASPSAPTQVRGPSAAVPTGVGPSGQKGAPPKLSAERLQELSGHKLGYFEVGPMLAKGQSGIVFKARDTQRNLDVALKVLWPEFARDENEVQRFIRAMKTILPLRHPNIVVLYAAGKTGPYCWLSMELVEGESVTRVIQRLNTGGQVSWKSAMRIAIFATRGLEYAHSQSIIHRNITPKNILLGKQPHVTKLADLMLAKAMEGQMAEHVTKPGEILGDVHYISPERTSGVPSDIDERSDIYGLGATFYALLTGHPPLKGKSMIETILKIRQEQPVPPRQHQPSTPAELENIVMKMLEKNPAARFQTATELRTALENFARSNKID